MPAKYVRPYSRGQKNAAESREDWAKRKADWNYLRPTSWVVRSDTMSQWRRL